MGRRNFNGKRKAAYKARLIGENGCRCHYCKRRVEAQLLTLDHVVPVSAGGTNNLDNLVLACQRCNEKKANRSAAKFIRQIERNKTYA